MIDLQTDKTGFADSLLRWHETHARDLPWRGEADPYRIWLSEIMLQQTRTETVKRYYETFLRAFPTVFDLANAEPEKVLKLWEGMGYYSRARNLHAAAKLVAREMNGEFPKTAETLRALPGVGEKVADCVLLFGMGRHDAFPMDVWMKRAVRTLYGGNVPDFGAQRGVAQQYLFYAARAGKFEL